MDWIILVIAGLFEVAWASLLPATKSFTRPIPSVLFVATLGISMYLLSVATRTIPIGTAYAVWVGVGAVGTFLVALLTGAQSTNLPQVIAVAVLILAIVAVRLTAH
ncbi:MAG TPA: multidrug efflux SMR transporter [Acidimicrobiia bacterium]|nr:multidrug efflux SMR transporter [Acidimicrobiia bacterium]